LAIFRDHRSIGRILLATFHESTGHIRFDRSPHRGAAATILSRVQLIRGNLLDFAWAQGKLVMMAKAAWWGYGLVERSHGSPSSTGRNRADETRQPPGHD
jgi:hypothetical protein